MGLFGKIVGTVVETAKLPVDIIEDTVKAFPDLCDEKRPGSRTSDRLEKIKEEAKGEE